MDEIKFELSPIGRTVWEDRYALKDDTGKIIEKDISETFRRVSNAISSKEKDQKKWEKKFFDILNNQQFCPAGRILAHSGTHFSQLLNCYVIPFKDDSLESIMETAKDMAVVQKYGGGTGFSYNKLRPEGAYIKGVNGRSCGSLGFLDMMSVISGVIEQGGSNVVQTWAYYVSHPDIWDFISYKNDHNWDRLREFIDIKDEERWEYFKYENPYKLQMYNVSVAVTDEFMSALEKDEVWPFIWDGKEWELYTVLYRKIQANGTYVDKKFEITADCEDTAMWKTKRKVPYPTGDDIFEVLSTRKVRSSEIWKRVCYNAWSDGCPGIINISTARKMHNGEYIHPIESTNPCGEQPLPPYGCCNLGSIVLPRFFKITKDGVASVDYKSLGETVYTSVRFLDNVIDNCFFPLNEIKKLSLKERRVGLGTMGIHDMLIGMKLDYDSEEGRKFVEKILTFIRDTAYKSSIDLAKEKGKYPDYKDKFLESGYVITLPEDIQKSIKEHGMRNTTVLSQAPTGTIGTMYSLSTGCEPWFDLSFTRNTRLGSYEDGCPLYLQWKKNNPEEKEIPSYFKTAKNISPENHLKMMIVFSKYMDTAVSKTVNLPGDSTVDDVSKIFLSAIKSGVKGLTVFRDGCKEGVLISKPKKEDDLEEDPIAEIKEEKKEEVVKVLNNGRKLRGNRVVGSTTRVHMQDHNLYVTVNKNTRGELVEVFATVGENKSTNDPHTSGVEDSWAEALGKTISLASRAGVNMNQIIRNLKNIPSDKPVFSTIGDLETSEAIPSPPHAIARVIEEESKYMYTSPQKNEDLNKIQNRCKYCSSTNVQSLKPGCLLCLDCGKSGCG